MINQATTRSNWTQVGLFLWLFGAGFVAAVAFQLLATSGHQPISLNTKRGLQMVSSILWFGIPALFYARLRFGSVRLDSLGFRPAFRANFYLLGILLLVCSFPLQEWLGLLNRHIPLAKWMIQTEEATQKELMSWLAVKSSFEIIFNLLVVAVIPGFFEEMCFRGTLQPILIRLTKSPWAGIFIAAFWFSFFHLEFSGFLPRFFLGILLGASYRYSGSLWTPVLGHCFFNGIQVLALYYYPEIMNDKNPSIPVLAMLFSLVIVAGLLAVMRRQYVQAQLAAQDIQTNNSI
jgi:membrane protease YdiL (CAAX protease family)